MLLHLARELARDLDRAHLGAEGTAEGAFDEAGDLAFETPEDTHGLPRRALIHATRVRRCGCFANLRAAWRKRDDRPGDRTEHRGGSAGQRRAGVVTRARSQRVAETSIADQTVTRRAPRASDRPASQHGSITAATPRPERGRSDARGSTSGRRGCDRRSAAASASSTMQAASRAAAQIQARPTSAAASTSQTQPVAPSAARRQAARGPRRRAPARRRRGR